MQARRARAEQCPNIRTDTKAVFAADWQGPNVDLLDSDLLKSIETELAGAKPFGESRYINTSTTQRYEHRLRMISDVFPPSRALLAALGQADEAGRWLVLSDPTVRIAINSGVAHCKMATSSVSLEHAEKILALAVRCLEAGSDVPPLQMGVRTPIHIGNRRNLWTWSDDRLEEDTPGYVFRSVYNAQEKGRTVLCNPDEACLSILQQGTSLLNELLPELSQSALDHAFLVGIVDHPDASTWVNEKRFLPFNSFTVLNIPGSLFIARPLLKTPWICAEYLLHEALHLKWYDLEHGHSMLRRGYNPETSPRIKSVWNRPGAHNLNEWHFCRSTAAFHVYVHLALFFQQVERQLPELERKFGPFTGDPVTVWVRRCCDRARYLGSQIQRNSVELGRAGELFVTWLLDALAKIDRNPTRLGSDMHLQLDMYESEAPTVAAILENGGSAVLFDTFSELEAVERAVARMIVVQGRAVDPEPYPCGTTEIRGRADARTLRRVRAWISSQLNALPPRLFDELRDAESGKTLRQLVATMISLSGAVLERQISKREPV